MADVKWIKITTDIFDDEKILLIESLPSADSIITIWFKLLVLAGKQNNNGVFIMNDKMPYTEEMLATIFRRDINTVRLALDTFEKFGMIERIEGVVTIPKWGMHQTLDSYEKKKARDRGYQRQRREKQREIVEKSSDNRLTSDDASDEQSPFVGVSESSSYSYSSSTSTSNSDSDSLNNNFENTKTYKDLVTRVIEKYSISEYLEGYVRDWLEYKKERNFRYKEVGLNTLIKTISTNAKEYGDETMATAIQESISSGYQGIVYDIAKKRARQTDVNRDRQSQFDYLLNDTWGGEVP